MKRVLFALALCLAAQPTVAQTILCKTVDAIQLRMVDGEWTRQRVVVRECLSDGTAPVGVNLLRQAMVSAGLSHAAIAENRRAVAAAKTFTHDPFCPVSTHPSFGCAPSSPLAFEMTPAFLTQR